MVAVDAKNGRVFWQYRYNNSPDQRVCCGSNNRGVAMLGDTLFMGTLDGHLVGDRREERQGRSGTSRSAIRSSATRSRSRRSIVKDKVIVGVGGGEFGIRGYITAHDPKTGREMWRF